MSETEKSRVWLTACSDPVRAERVSEIEELVGVLRETGLETVLDPAVLGPDPMTPKQKADLLMRAFHDERTDYIFDISGGDLANTVLPYLDFELIKNSRAVFFGYSDLTVVINAIIAKTGKCAVNYQIRHILHEHGEVQREYLRRCILRGGISVSDLEYVFLRGSSMRGRVLGGNIRCFLKLAGTPFWPDLTGSILLLESLGGGVYQMRTALEQYCQMGVFERVSGILLGTFSNMEENCLQPSVEEMVLDLVPGSVPVAKTRLIGHYSDAKAIVLGREAYFG